MNTLLFLGEMGTTEILIIGGLLLFLALAVLFLALVVLLSSKPDKNPRGDNGQGDAGTGPR